MELSLEFFFPTLSGVLIVVGLVTENLNENLMNNQLRLIQLIKSCMDVSKMNQEDNYQSLRGNVARINDVTNDDESTYTELSKTRGTEDNYQSLT